MKYIIKLIIHEYTKVNDGYDFVDVTTNFTFYNWDDVQNFIGYMVDGREGEPIRFEITTVKEEN